MKSIKNIQAIIFDWAGTTIDFGSCAPTEVFKRAFAKHGISITTHQAREPMGRAKRDHIECILKMPNVAEQWQATHQASYTSLDLDSIYNRFMELQGETLRDFCKLIDGIAELAQWCSEVGISIGSTTGYVRSQIEVLLREAAKQGYLPQCAIGADDVPVGRPAPFLLYEACKHLNVYPMSKVICVDDTPVGIEAGRNAGCWTIGVSRTGNEVGLSESELNSLPESEQCQLIELATARLYGAGAHFVVQSVAELQPIVKEIDDRIERDAFVRSL